MWIVHSMVIGHNYRKSRLKEVHFIYTSNYNSIIMSKWLEWLEIKIRKITDKDYNEKKRVKMLEWNVICIICGLQGFNNPNLYNAFFYWSGDNLIFEDLKKNLALPISQYNIYLSGKCNIGNRAHKLVSVLTIPPLIKVFRNFSVFLLVIIKSPLKTIYFIRFWKICEIVSEN